MPAKPRIMIVEDESITALDIRTSLEKLDYEVAAIVSSGPDAIKTAAEIQPDLIIMDITLQGGMTGIEAADHIHSMQKTPIIFLTAHYDNSSVSQAVAVEPFGYLTKPCSIIDLRNTIEVALYKSAADARVRNAEERLRIGLEQLVAKRTTDYERTNRELAEFCYAISHELRATIARIQGMSAALLDECSKCPNGSSRIFANRIHHAGLQQRKVVDSILLLSRLSSTDFKRQEVDLSKLVAGIMQDLLDEGPAREVSLAIAPDIMTEADHDLMHACLENLLRNALKFTAFRKEAHIEFGIVRQLGETVYFVRDNGVGFDMKYVEKLFVPFQRLHRQEEYPGSGIGLATVSRIVNRHGGRVWAKAEPDKGATFFFTLGKE